MISVISVDTEGVAVFNYEVKYSDTVEPAIVHVWYGPARDSFHAMEQAEAQDPLHWGHVLGVKAIGTEEV